MSIPQTATGVQVAPAANSHDNNGSNDTTPPISTVENPETDTAPQHEQAFRYVIKTNGRQLRDSSDEAIQALELSNTPPHLFYRSAIPVRIRKDERDRPFIEPMTEAAMRHELTKSADFYEMSSRGNRPVDPPLSITRDVMSRDDLPFPPLGGIIEVPALRPDGTILDTPGYDWPTGVYYAPAPGLTVPPIPINPTAEETEQARALLDEAIADFPFVDDASRDNARALIITPLLRPAISGATPMAVADAPQAGTGKTMLINVSAIISTARPAALEHMPTDEAEMDKRLTSSAMEGAPFNAYDDISTPIASSSLARAITATELKGRILGKSATVTLLQRATWAASGNNIRLGGDMPRRCYWIRMDAETWRPWQRTGFRHPDLLAWVQEHRGELIAAVLTLARAWYAAGCPDGNSPTMGSFEQWSKVIGGVLAHAGTKGFLQNLEELHNAADDEGNEWEAFLIAWRATIGEQSVSVAELCNQVAGSANLREALPNALADALASTPDKFKQRTGIAFKKRVGRRFGESGFHLERAEDDTHNKVARWKVAGTAGTAGTSTTLTCGEKPTNNHTESEREQSPQTPQSPQIGKKLVVAGYGHD